MSYEPPAAPRTGFCIYINTFCQGPVPLVTDGEGKYVVFTTEREAQLEIVDNLETRLQQLIAEQREGTLNRVTWESVAAAQQLAGTAQLVAGGTGDPDGADAQASPACRETDDRDDGDDSSKHLRQEAEEVDATRERDHEQRPEAEQRGRGPRQGVRSPRGDREQG